jgi:hypothetical protein
MMMSARMMQPILRTVVIGAGLGLLYGSTKTAASQFGFTGELDPKPEAFHMEKMATHLFIQLGRFRNYTDACDRHYRQALLCTDKLLFLEKRLASGDMIPEKDDERTACGYIAQIRVSCSEFMAELPPRAHPVVEGIVKELWSTLQVHMGNIMKLCDGEDIIHESAEDRQVQAMLARYS